MFVNPLGESTRVSAETKAALRTLWCSLFAFHLGGSRRMAELAESEDLDGSVTIPIDSNTDWDFYATYHFDLYKDLTDNGFYETDFSAKVVETGYSLDDEARCILQRGNVQVVLRKDANFYRMVFESIPIQFYHDYLWKSSPAQPDRSMIQPIFNALFAMAHAVQGR